MANALQAVLDKAARGRNEDKAARGRDEDTTARGRDEEKAAARDEGQAARGREEDRARGGGTDETPDHGTDAAPRGGGADAATRQSRRVRASAGAAASPSPSPRSRPRAPEHKSAPVPAHESEAARRPVREGKRFVGAHVEPEVARQLKMIAAEDDTTVQNLLEEALDLLFAKKGKAALAVLTRHAD